MNIHKINLLFLLEYNSIRLKEVFHNIWFVNLILIIVACSTNERKKKPDFQTSVKQISLVPVNTIQLEIDAETSVNNYFYDVFSVDTVEYLGIINRNKNALQVYSLASNKLYREITLEKQGPDAFSQLRAFTFINQDSILLFSLYAKDIWLIDMNGKIKARYDFRNISGERPFSLGIVFYSGLKPIFSNGKVYLRTQSKLVDNLTAAHFNEDNKLELKLDLRSESWEYVDISFPELYRNNIWSSDISRTLTNDGKIVYSFGICPYLVLYDLASKTQIKYPAQSKYVVKVMPLVNKSEAERYFFETPKYGIIAYDKYRNLYYRFVKHHLTITDPVSGQMNQYDDASFSIVVLDGEFNKIGETKFKPSTYKMNEFFIAKDGLYISASNTKNPIVNEDMITFEIFKPAI